MSSDDAFSGPYSDDELAKRQKDGGSGIPDVYGQEVQGAPTASHTYAPFAATPEDEQPASFSGGSSTDAFGGSESSTTQSAPSRPTDPFSTEPGGTYDGRPAAAALAHFDATTQEPAHPRLPLGLGGLISGADSYRNKRASLQAAAENESSAIMGRAQTERLGALSEYERSHGDYFANGGAAGAKPSFGAAREVQGTDGQTHTVQDVWNPSTRQYEVQEMGQTGVDPTAAAKNASNQAVAGTRAASSQSVAQTNAGAKTGAAAISAGASRYGADVRGGASRYGADVRAGSARDVANTNAKGRTDSATIANYGAPSQTGAPAGDDEDPTATQSAPAHGVAPPPPSTPNKVIVGRGVDRTTGKQVVRYSDGTAEFRNWK